jgi:hypothetical protein
MDSIVGVKRQCQEALMPYSLFPISADSLRKAAACNLAARCQGMEEHLGHLLSSDEPLSAEIWWNLPSTSEKDMI